MTPVMLKKIKVHHIHLKSLFLFSVLVSLSSSTTSHIFVSKPSALHSWRDGGKAGMKKRNELPAGATWKSPKPSASHLSG